MTTPADTAALSPEAAATLRHDLRTPLNHVVGYCEMLLEDAADPALAPRRAALEQALAAGRDALTLINTSLPGTGRVVPLADLAALRESLRAPQQRILSAVTTLLASPDADDGFAADLRRIRNSAEGLGQGLATRGPRPEAPGADAAGPATHTAPEAGGAAAARILVVDDGAENRDLLARRLAREGYAVAVAEDGARALARVAREPFDLVLLDVMMPELDGFAVLERLKGDPATRDIPVIMISALDDVASVVRCIEHGAEDYLPKPFDPVLLRARITASLEKKRLRDTEVEYLRQVSRVIEAASAVEAGRYTAGGLSDLARRADALGRLARVFDGMATEVRAREERLHRQVESLRQEIEVARRAGAGATVADHSRLPLGTTFAGRYRVDDVVGSGAMGTVYRAHDRELDETIALKALRPEFVNDAALLERFKTEIRLARRITHPNVVRTHDFGECDGIYYLTMEYVEGITVQKLIDTRGHLGVASTVAVARQLAQALDVAHGHGVIHRDLKPPNLLLDDAGLLKVMDFGVARLAERSATITEAGLVVGTPAYMAPEQLLGEAVDARSDLYAVGAVLYECLTGRLPFQASTAVSLIAKLLKDEPVEPLGLTAEVPPALGALVLRLLAKRPEDRVQTAAELGRLLNELG